MYDVINEQNGKAYIYPSSDGDYANAQSALAAVERPSVVYSAGTHHFTSGLIKSAVSDIELMSGAIWTTSSESSVGMIQSDVGRLRIHGGGKVIVDNHVTGQAAIEARGDSPQISGLRFERISGEGSDSDNCSFIRMIGSADGVIDRCHFKPRYGTIDVTLENSFRTIHSKNYHGSGTEIPFGNGGSPELVGGTGGVLVNGGEWNKIVDNTFYGVGDTGSATDTKKVSYAVRLVKNAATGVESGHHMISNNHVEFYQAKRVLLLEGALWTSITGNMIGYLSEGPEEQADGAIVLDQSSGIPTAYCHISGNQLHNCCGNEEPFDKAAYITLLTSVSATISSNDFNILRESATPGAGHRAIRVLPDNCERLVIQGNRFESKGITDPTPAVDNATPPIVFESGAFLQRSAVVDNVYGGFDNLIEGTPGLLTENNNTDISEIQ